MRGGKLCLARADEEAALLAAEVAVQKDLDCFVSAVETEMEISAKAKPFIEIEVIAANAKTTVEIEASSGIAMGDPRNP
jgi:hypothetical protein